MKSNELDSVLHHSGVNQNWLLQLTLVWMGEIRIRSSVYTHYLHTSGFIPFKDLCKIKLLDDMIIVLAKINRMHHFFYFLTKHPAFLPQSHRCWALRPCSNRALKLVLILLSTRAIALKIYKKSEGRSVGGSGNPFGCISSENKSLEVNCFLFTNILLRRFLCNGQMQTLV